MIESLSLWLDGRVVMQRPAKPLYAGSIPASASKFCPGGGIGRHKGFKIPRRQLRAGSSPALGTNVKKYLNNL